MSRPPARLIGALPLDDGGVVDVATVGGVVGIRVRRADREERVVLPLAAAADLAELLQRALVCPAWVQMPTHDVRGRA